jgi:hypothetical protein
MDYSRNFSFINRAGEKMFKNVQGLNGALAAHQ